MTLPSDDKQRLDALKRYFILDAPVEDGGVRITRVAAQLYGVAHALLLVRDGDTDRPTAAYGLDLASLPADAVYFERPAGPALPVVVADATTDARFARNPLVHGELAVRFVAQVPLKSRHGFTLGTLALMDQTPQELNGEGVAVLVDLAGAIEPELELRRAFEERDALESARLSAEAEATAFRQQTADLTAQLDALTQHATALDAHTQTMDAHARAADAQRAEAEERLAAAGAAWQSERAAWQTAHAALAAGKAEAEHTARLETLFLAGVSHQVRTALTSILGYAEVLAEELGDDGKEMADMILSSGQRLEQILRTALDLARLESDGAAPRLDAVDVGAVVEAAARAFAPVAEKRDLALYVEGPLGDAAPRAWADPGALARVLDNLLSNAFRFTERGGVRIRISTEVASDRVCVDVQDTGIGIDEAHVSNLFDESRLERSVPQPDDGVEHGVGLGLAITRRLVELMGGAISVQSVKGQGSVFRILLHRAAAPAEAPTRDDADGVDPALLADGAAFAGDGAPAGPLSDAFVATRRPSDDADA